TGSGPVGDRPAARRQHRHWRRPGRIAAPGAEPAAARRSRDRRARAAGGAGAEPQLVRFEIDGEPGPWCRWSRVTIDDLDELARASGLVATRTWCHSGRWFARL